MNPERVDFQALLESLADGVDVDWAALDARAATSADRTRYRNLRLVARVAELHRTLVLDDADESVSLHDVADGAFAADPTTWGHLSVTSRLASGAFGQIYRARDSQLHREVALKLLRGNIGKPGAGAAPIRGHSNVQGDRTMGIWEQMRAPFLDALESEFGFAPPREHPPAFVPRSRSPCRHAE